MNSKTPVDSRRPLSDGQRLALIRLLGDDDPKVHDAVKARLVACGPDVVPWLRPHLVDDDPVLRRHAREIVLHFRRADADAEFLAFCLNQGEDLDLERGIGLLCQTRYPEANLEVFTAQLDQISKELRVRSITQVAPQQRLLTVTHYLFNEIAFRGDAQYESDPESCYFNRIMERHAGNPIGLCALLLLVCKRLGLPVAGIGLPGHFVCRFQTPTVELYIDCFNQGRFLTKTDCVQYLHATNHALEEGYLAPISTRRILMRMCANLQQTYLRLNDEAEAGLVKRYLVALAN
ncbi:MAG: hypothetical protein HYR88_08180 [Verrucomicrobia bacterium]|nr:hypothetical protein [Verrucomicrobiota bacterium]MBI3868460.1 hypothetical protein [Verrucomicrobiota bacterium]